jgi:hypothetical protein
MIAVYASSEEKFHLEPELFRTIRISLLTRVFDSENYWSYRDLTLGETWNRS